MIAPKVLLQHVVPQHLLSRVAGRVAECPWSWVKLPLILLFIRLFRVDMSEAERQRPSDYDTFNDFFTRPLKPSARDLCDAPDAMQSPVDGTVSQIGTIDADRIVQAKGISYTVGELLGGATGRSASYEDGAFATLYLSPRDYHRVHAPLSGDLFRSLYIPGRLFSVDEITTRDAPNLFARNERLVMHFDSAIGPVAVVMVGAMIVAGIQPGWHTSPYAPARLADEAHDPPLKVERGEELGRFRLGSTVIILCARDRVDWLEELRPGSPVRLGSRLGTLTPSRN